MSVIWTYKILFDICSRNIILVPSPDNVFSVILCSEQPLNQMPTYLKRPRISIVSSENGWYTSINFPKDMAMFPSRDEAIRNLSKSLSQLLESKVDLSEVDLKTGERKLIPGGLYHILCLENSDFVAFSKQTVKRKRNGSSKKRRK